MLFLLALGEGEALNNVGRTSADGDFASTLSLRGPTEAQSWPRSSPA